MLFDATSGDHTREHVFGFTGAEWELIDMALEQMIEASDSMALDFHLLRERLYAAAGHAPDVLPAACWPYESYAPHESYAARAPLARRSTLPAYAQATERFDREPGAIGEGPA